MSDEATEVDPVFWTEDEWLKLGKRYRDATTLGIELELLAWKAREWQLFEYADRLWELRTSLKVKRDAAKEKCDKVGAALTAQDNAMRAAKLPPIHEVGEL